MTNTMERNGHDLMLPINQGQQELRAYTPVDVQNCGSALRGGTFNFYVGHEDPVMALNISLFTGLLTALEGESGVGKTYLAKVMAGLSGLTYGEILFSGGVLPSDVEGSVYYDKREGTFKVRLTHLTTKQVVLLDEISRALTKVMNSLNGVLGDGEVILSGGEFVLPVKKLFTPIMTLNPEGREGVNKLTEALLNRVGASIWMDELTEDQNDQVQDKPLFNRSTPAVLNEGQIIECRRVIAECETTMQPQAKRLNSRIVSAFKHSDLIESGTSVRTLYAIRTYATALSVLEQGVGSAHVGYVQRAAHACIPHAVEFADIIEEPREKRARIHQMIDDVVNQFNVSSLAPSVQTPAPSGKGFFGGKK